MVQQVGTSAYGLRLASHAVAAGQVIAYPTEAVYGLGCDPRNVAAVTHLLALKRRSSAKGLIIVAADVATVLPYVAHTQLTAERWATITATWPGAVTWLLPAQALTPHWLTGGAAVIAVRVSAHPMVVQLCRQWGGALVSTSANVTGLPPARTALQVRRRVRGELLIVTGDCGGAQRPSMICDGQTGRVLRK